MTPRKGRYKFETFSNTFGHSLIFDKRKTKEEKYNGFDENDNIMLRYLLLGGVKIYKIIF